MPWPQIVHNVLRNAFDTCVVWITLDMTKDVNTQRLFCRETGLTYAQLEQPGSVGDEVDQALMEAQKSLKPCLQRFRFITRNDIENFLLTTTFGEGGDVLTKHLGALLYERTAELKTKSQTEKALLLLIFSNRFLPRQKIATRRITSGLISSDTSATASAI